MFQFFSKNEIPELNEYFPSMENMNREQRIFYKSLRKSLKSNKYVEVGGNISYVFLYLYELLNEYCGKDFRVLYDILIQFSEFYKSESKEAIAYNIDELSSQKRTL